MCVGPCALPVELGEGFGGGGDALEVVGAHYVGVFDAYGAHTGYHEFGLDGYDVAFGQHVAAARGQHGGFVDFYAEAVAHESGFLVVAHEVVGEAGFVGHGGGGVVELLG